ncbi:MAG: YARHG domain-containing protein [Spirochaetales bacterium]|nr:YARHG domain-containing protein [Spirochaetales bacterium]
MKRSFFIYWLIFSAALLAANDAFVETAGGHIRIRDENKNIEIVSEVLDIELNENTYSITVTYGFLNNGPSETITTAFPQYQTNEGVGSSAEIRNFQIKYGNGRTIDHSFVSAEEKLDAQFVINGWYVKDITFRENKITEIQITYEAVYGQYGTYQSAQYLLGTGSTWQGPIKKLEINITNNTSNWIHMVEIAGSTNYTYKTLSSNKYQIQKADYEPALKDEIIIGITDEPKTRPRLTSDRNFLLKSKTLDRAWFRFLSAEQLRIMRNMIYAYHGYQFKANDLQVFFKNQRWYEPNESFSISLFSENEKNNVKIIQEIEEEIN